MAGTNQPSQKPYTGGQSGAYSGTRGSNDPTTEPGQYPPESNGIFGGPLPTGTGAPGTRGGGGDSNDPTVVAGQLVDGLTGVPDSAISSTGAPGTATSPGTGGGGSTVTYTRPGSHLTGTYAMESSSETLTGPGESTEANSQGYGTGGPQLPGIKGNEPVPGGKFQPGSGRVLRGGRSVRG